MFCEKCGSKLNNGNAFCSSCGAPIKTAAVNSGTSQSQASMNQPQGQTSMNQPQGQASMSQPQSQMSMSQPQGQSRMSQPQSQMSWNNSTAVKSQYRQIPLNFLVVNALLIMIYFLGWLKISGSDIGFLFDAADEIGFNIKNSFSPHIFVKLFNAAKDISTPSEIPEASNMLYLLLVMPVGGAFSIVLTLLKQNKFAIVITIISSIITILLIVVAFILSLTDEMATKLGVYIALVVVISAIVVSFKHYKTLD